MLKPARSRIVAVESSHRCDGCHKAGILVTLERANGRRVQAWTHDDGSFVEWTGESAT